MSGVLMEALVEASTCDATFNGGPPLLQNVDAVNIAMGICVHQSGHALFVLGVDGWMTVITEDLHAVDPPHANCQHEC
eukprot:scaffold219771_cov22-Tisochrysis_lutea.AAC.1